MTNLEMHLPSSGTDEALWDAYRHDDKAAVTDYLFRRSLVGIARSRAVPAANDPNQLERRPAARRAHGEAMLINDGAQ
jgi:hypothetical protein